jgi:hypothetical protein
LLIVLASCSGGGGDVELSTPEPTPEASALLDLDRFHYVATLELHGADVDEAPDDVIITTEGDFQAPDRHSFSYTTQLSGATIRESAVVIGGRVWLRAGDSAWREATPEDPQAQELFATAFSPIRPGFLGGADFRRVRDTVRRLPSTLEFVNEIRANHYQVGQEAIEYLEAFLSDEALLTDAQHLRWDVWLAEEGVWPVRLVASGTVTSDLGILQQLNLKPPSDWLLRIDITRPNDPALSVQAPLP